MQFLTEKEIEEQGYEYGSCLKYYEAKNGDIAALWHAEKNWIVHNNYLVEEEGYYIYVIMEGTGWAEKLEAKNIVEACAAFNTVLATIKA